MKYFLLSSLFFLLSMSTAYGQETSSASQSGAISGAASQAGSIGYIDNATHSSVVEATDVDETVPNVFSAGVTAGGSNPCIVSIGGGLSVAGGGINFANAYNDGECNVRESLRLMAAISASEEATNQILLREVACQSVTLWDAMERTYMETQDERYMCSNTRPEDPQGIIAFRRNRENMEETALVTPDPDQHKLVTRAQQYSNGFWD